MVQREEKKKKERFTDTKIITKSHLFGRQITFTATGLSDSVVNLTNVSDIPDLFYYSTHHYKASKTVRSCCILYPSPARNMSFYAGPELSNGGWSWGTTPKISLFLLNRFLSGQDILSKSPPSNGSLTYYVDIFIARYAGTRVCSEVHMIYQAAPAQTMYYYEQA